MRKAILGALLAAAFTFSVGCVIPIYSADRNKRARQLIYDSENLRQIPEIWERTWFLDMPDTATPFRTHGGVI